MQAGGNSALPGILLFAITAAGTARRVDLNTIDTPQSTLTIHVGKRKIKLRPEELQKVAGERGRRGTLMRGLQRIDRVEIDSPRRASSGDSEE